MANPDGSVIIDTKINTDGVEDGAKEIKKKLNKVSDAAEKTAEDQAEAMKDAWKKTKAESAKGSKEIVDDLDDIGEQAEKTGKNVEGILAGLVGGIAAGVTQKGMDALKKAGESLAEFGKASMELSSDLQEVQNVVDVTFTTMSDKVNEFAKSADASAGLSETMAKEYAGTFGTMAKSMGFAEAEAYKLATSLAQFTGDLASFRNLSQDEAFTKLQAIFTGETESLKALGVVLTQTNLDAFALANGFGKTTDAMTEQEKVSLRYQYVMDQLSAAQGDFVRTQDSWANQTKTLELQLENLKTTVGEGLIGVLSPLVGLINDAVVPALQDMATKFAEAVDPTPAEEFQGSINRLKDTMSDVDTEFTAAIAEIERTSFAVDACVESMKELEASGLDTAEAQNQYAAAVEYLNGLLPDLNAQIDKNTGLIDKNTQEIYKNLDAMKQQVKYKAYQKLLESHEAAINDLAAAEAELYKTQWERQGLEQQLQETYGYSLEQIHELGMGVLEMNIAMDGGIGSADDMALAFGKVDKSVSGLTPELQEMLLDVVDLTSQEKGLNTAIAEMNATLAESDPMLKAFMEDVMGISDAAGEATDNLEGMTGSVVAGTSGALSGTSDIVAGVMDELSLETDRTYSELTQGLENNADVIRQHIENLAALMSSGAPDSLISQFTNSNSATMAALNEAMQASNGQFTELIGNFNEYERATQELRQVISDWEHQTELTAVAATQSLEEVWAQYQQQSIDWVQSRMNLVNTESDKAKSEARMLVNEAEKLADEASEYFSKSYKAKEEENYQQAAKYHQMAVEKQREAREILAEAQKLYGSEGTVGIIEDAMKRVEGASQSLSGAVEETTNSISDNFEEVVGFLESETGISADRIREIVFGSRDEVVGAVEEAGEAAADASKKASDEVVDNTEVAIDKIQSLIWGLDGTEVVIDIFERVHRAEGYAYGYAYDSYDPQSYSIPYSVPYLAEGAVIPPNAPFMAVLGDQRNGTNIEAPADLIRQIVREEMESIELGVDVNFSGDLAPLISLLTPKITAEQRRNSRAGGY